MNKVLLKDLGEIITGNTPSKKNESYYCSEDIPFFKPSDLNDNSIELLNNSEEYISENARNVARILPAGTVLVTCIGTIGKVGILNVEATCNQQINAIIPNDKVDTDYLAYLITSKKYYMKAKANAPVVPILNKTNFSNIQVSICELKEQKKIARVLNGVQNIIRKRKQQLDGLEELIKSQFVEMFGDPFITNKSWEVKELKDISSLIADGSNVDKNLYKTKSDVLFLRIQNVWRNEFRLDDSVYISAEENKDYYDTSLKHGDLLICKIGRNYTKDTSLGRVSIYLGEDDRANYSNNIMRIRLKNDVNCEYINLLLNLKDYQEHIKRVSKGGTDKRALNKSIIGSLPIILPPRNLQDEYINKVHQIDKQKFEMQKSLEEMQNLYESLMNQYFGQED